MVVTETQVQQVGQGLSEDSRWEGVELVEAEIQELEVDSVGSEHVGGVDVVNLIVGQVQVEQVPGRRDLLSSRHVQRTHLQKRRNIFQSVVAEVEPFNLHPEEFQSRRAVQIFEFIPREIEQLQRCQIRQVVHIQALQLVV